jgi:Leucine-rich repeat (LRR) protein
MVKILDDFIHVREDEKISKCFSALVMLYHPDKGEHYRKQIDNIYHSGNHEELNNFTHIFSILNVEGDVPNMDYDLDVDYTPGYVWDPDEFFSEGFIDEENLPEDYFYPPEYESIITFFSAVKRRLYGSMQVDLSPHFLEDLEEIEMAGYEIEDLEGLRFCKHVMILDLSGNLISDIDEMSDLKYLEEVYLADNQIDYIDGLKGLKKIRVMDLSNNLIDNIDPLLHLPNLEYVNLMGNCMPEKQVEVLRSLGVIVLT